MMETRVCPTCKSINPGDVDHCIICGGLLEPVADGQGSAMPTRKLVPPPQQSENNESSHSEEPLSGQALGNPTSEGRSKLRSILSNDSGLADLEGLIGQGMLHPDDQELISKGSNKAGDPGSTGQGTPGTTLPDWLRSAEFGRPEANREDAIGETMEGEDAHPADLPDWVKRLQENIGGHRPEEESSQADLPIQADEVPVEIQPILKHTRTTGAFQAITLPDQQLVTAVKAYLGDLRSPRRQPADRNRRMSRLSWGAIGLAMIGLIAILTWSGTTVAGLPETGAPELKTIGSFIDQMAPESVVLVGMDYDLPLAGEMENASLPVITHLMSKQVNLFFLTTRPVGPAMAEHLIALALKWQPGFPIEKIHIAAFLPGGPVGLVRFVLDPRGALPVSANGSMLWAEPGLNQIERVADFSQVLLITDSMESGRDWLEQVKPWIGTVPLDVIASNQAANLLRPYQVSGQIRAMLSGIVSGASYERMTMMTTSNQLLIRAYRGGLVFMIVLVASSLILATLIPEKWLTRQKGKKANASG